jgi:hypothetical protein
MEPGVYKVRAKECAYIVWANDEAEAIARVKQRKDYDPSKDGTDLAAERMPVPDGFDLIEFEVRS